jgi:hypothetical protein
LTLASVVTADTVTIPTSVTVDAKGRVTAISHTLAENSFISGNTSNVATSGPMIGDASLENKQLVLNTVNSNIGTFLNCTVNGKGLCTAANNTLTAGNLLVGNVSNVATSTSLSGDATLSNSGVLTLANTTVVAGDYVMADISVDSKGRIISIDDGVSPGNNTVDCILSRTIS